MSRLQLLLSCLVLHTSVALCQTDAPVTAAEEEVTKARAALEELANSYERLDPRLLEPVADLANRLLLLGNYDEAHVLLDQAAQIARVVDGLYTMNQIPFLLGKAENYANRNDWLHAREQMEHLYWLLSRQENVIDDALIANLLRLSDLHLRGIAEDEKANQPYHFRAALAPNRLALVIAREHWGDIDPRLAPLLYRLVQNYYLQAKAVEIGGATGSALRTFTGSGLSQTRAESRMAHYHTGQLLLLEIRSLFEQQTEAAPEAVALANLYLADWEVVFSNAGPALAAYQRSFAGFRSAGISIDDLNSYFSQPSLLPAPRFHSRWDELVMAREVGSTPQNSIIAQEAVMLRFQERSSNLPFANVARGALAPEAAVAAQNSALFSFHLAGLEQTRIWNRGRLKNLVGTARNLEWLRRSFSQAVDVEALEEEILEIRFRPKLIDGIPQPVDATLHYELAMDN